MIKRKAYAKINLALDVLGKFPNGYHEVRMVMQTIDLYDVLTFSVYDCEAESKIRLMGEENKELSLGEDNLIYKAASSLVDYFPEGKGVEIRLEKNIPIAAGMAGGSTDAAATLHGINELFGLGMNDEALCEIGVRLGADVPYCILGGTMLAEGIGEKLTRLPDSPELILVVAKPEMGVSTKYVYEHLDAYENPPHPDVDGMLEAISEGDSSKVAKGLGNILETVTIPACPDVAAIKEILSTEGAEGVLMSGSGPTVFAVFSDAEAAERAAEILRNNSPAKFVCTTKTCRGDLQ